mmetsp:Transcript_24967/g.61448  ORF Transcript_24967/g.61448 Transcript_24967/m.61448 type:complete len:159 (+) Transcript_24967:193-669(+)|eukprot:CAMPEP_0113631292 /NCGR_PEP_ID=MMETSP0017_2-20120614/16261_1 /TAXON_ID=2856 /ORGANISM="Cylindrotheca closterium" /LENGTH=158 /DNA_ID=CAMNT_0000541795 /DNA_START=104 /DNA_END=580 /DNA_ORIENTATION=+ /assembly_acc=CAM_ASM_000147
MSAPGLEFQQQQQDLASKKHSKLEDHEKMTLMRREIDHLRNVIREQNDGTLQSAKRDKPESVSSSSSTTSNSSSAMDRAPVLTLFLFVGLLVVAIWRRRRTNRGTSFLPTTTTSSQQQQQIMTFELQDSFYEAPATNSTATISSSTAAVEQEAQTFRI